MQLRGFSNFVALSRPHLQALLATAPLSLPPVSVAESAACVKSTILVVSTHELVIDVTSLPYLVLAPAGTTVVSFPSSARQSSSAPAPAPACRFSGRYPPICTQASVPSCSWASSFMLSYSCL